MKKKTVKKNNDDNNKRFVVPAKIEQCKKVIYVPVDKRKRCIKHG